MSFSFTHEGVVGPHIYMASSRPAPRYPSFESFSVSTCSARISKNSELHRWRRNILAAEAVLGVSKSPSARGELICKLTAFRCRPTTRASSGEIGGVASKAGQAPGVYRSPFPLLDSPYRISSASITNYMHTSLLRAIARSLHAALGFWNRESISLIPQFGNL